MSNKLTVKLSLTKGQNFWTGIVLCAVGVLAAIYVGGWVFFIGGIVQIVEAIKADPVSGWGILLGWLRWVLSWPAFYVTGILIFGTGMSFISTSEKMG